MNKKKFGEKMDQTLKANLNFIDTSTEDEENAKSQVKATENNTKKILIYNEQPKSTIKKHIKDTTKKMSNKNAHTKDAYIEKIKTVNTTVHTTIQPKKQKKNERFNLVIREELVGDFNMLCEHMGIKRTYVINEFISSFIKANKKILKEIKKVGDD